MERTWSIERLPGRQPAVDRTAARVAEPSADTMVLTLPLAGRPPGGRDGSLVHLRAGDVAFVDSVRRFQLGSVRPFSPVPMARPRRSAQAVLTEKALAHIDAMLGDPTLSPRDVAQRIAVSPRQLHRLFADRGTTFGRALLGRRLARAHAFLTDPDHADRPIGEIAHEIGFADPSYFARAFRVRYGMTPRETRRAAG
jgi:AraC-like DNA-binding protein